MSWVTPGRTITETDVVWFAGLSGDYNPLHTNSVEAGLRPLGQRVAHGALVFSIVGGLRARLNLFDESLIAALGVRDWRFVAPVFIGDTIHCESEIGELRMSSKGNSGVVVHKVRVMNQHKDLVHEGIVLSLVRVGCAKQ